MSAGNPRDYNHDVAKFMQGRREEVEVARDEASLTELGARVASDRNFHDNLGGEHEVWVVKLAEQAQQTAVHRDAWAKADTLPAVPARVALTGPETRALERVLRNARLDTLHPSRGSSRRSPAEVLDEVRDDLAGRRIRAEIDAERATAKQRGAVVDQAVSRYRQRLKAARTRRARRGQGREGRSLDG